MITDQDGNLLVADNNVPFDIKIYGLKRSVQPIVGVVIKFVVITHPAGTDSKSNIMLFVNLAEAMDEYNKRKDELENAGDSVSLQVLSDVGTVIMDMHVNTIQYDDYLAPSDSTAEFAPLSPSVFILLLKLPITLELNKEIKFTWQDDAKVLVDIPSQHNDILVQLFNIDSQYWCRTKDGLQLGLDLKDATYDQLILLVGAGLPMSIITQMQRSSMKIPSLLPTSNSLIYQNPLDLSTPILFIRANNRLTSLLLGDDSKYFIITRNLLKIGVTDLSKFTVNKRIVDRLVANFQKSLGK